MSVCQQVVIGIRSPFTSGKYLSFLSKRLFLLLMSTIVIIICYNIIVNGYHSLSDNVLMEPRLELAIDDEDYSVENDLDLNNTSVKAKRHGKKKRRLPNAIIIGVQKGGTRKYSTF